MYNDCFIRLEWPRFRSKSPFMHMVFKADMKSYIPLEMAAIFFLAKQNRESTKGYSRWKVE